MKRVIGVTAVALLALAGCSKKAETGASATASATAPAGPAASVSTTTSSATMPQRKPGLWEQTMSSDRVNQVTRICIDKAVETKMSWSGQQTTRSGCEKTSMTPRLGGGWEFSSSCDLGEGGKIVSHGVVSGDFGGHYSVDMESTTTGSSIPQANGVHKMKMESSWKGPCPADMKPGDVEMPGGMKFNVLEAMAGKPPTGAGTGHMGPADIAKLRAQAKAMEAASKGEK